MAYIPQKLRSILTPLINWTGRRGVSNTLSALITRIPGINGVNTTLNSLPSRYNQPYYTELWNLFLTPYIFRGILFRDISRLWTGAAPILGKNGEEKARAQIINPREEETEQLDLLRWNIDEYLDRDMKQVLEQVSAAKLIFGKAVQEIVWERQTQGEHKGKILIKDFRDVDPTLFQINPKGYPPGLYMQNIQNWSVSSQWERVDERRFWIITNHQYFDDQNGISELEPLRKTEPRRAQAENDWGRAAQRSGRGHIIGKYAKRLRGAAARADRDEFLEALKQMSSDTVTAMDEENQVEILDAVIHNEVFQGLSDELKMQISLVLTGSPTTLKEGKFGNRSMAESTTVRQESELEQGDAADISGSFSQQVAARFCDFNWAETDPYPFMQLIDPNYIAPTTPDDQKTQDEISADNEEQETIQIKTEKKSQEEEQEQIKAEIVKESIIKFQEEQPEGDQKIPPAAVPPAYGEFPDTEPEPEIYLSVLDRAQTILENMSVKNYNDVTVGEAANTFTIKQFRSFENSVEILTKLKNAIIPTLSAKTEEDAWRDYYKEAIIIFAESDLNMTPQIRGDLILSFRQARQNAFGQAILEAGAEDDKVIGYRLETRGDDRVRSEHKLWNNVTLKKTDPLLKKLKCPMDFGCRCNWMPVYYAEASQYPITPKNKIPRTLPGDSYKHYAQPKEEVK